MSKIPNPSRPANERPGPLSPVRWLGAIFSAIGRSRDDAGRATPAQERLEVLAELSAALSAASTRKEVAAIVVENGTEAMDADACTLYVLDGLGSLDLIGDVGVAPAVLDKIRRISADSGNPSFETLRTGKPLWAESEAAYGEIFPSLASLKVDAPRARAFWSCPLVVEGHPIGLLGMGFYRPRRFDPDERRFIETFTGYCSQALRRAQRLEAEQRARRAAERAEASLATTLRSIGDAVIATDKKGDVTFMNPVAEQLTGWLDAEARGQPLKGIFHIVNEETRLEVESPVDKVLERGVVVGLANHTVLLGRKPGQETPIDDSGAPIRDDAGAVEGVVLVFRDVSAKKREEVRQAFVADATTTLASSLDYRATLATLARMMVPRFADWCAVDVAGKDGGAPQRLAVTHVDPGKVRFALDLAERYPEPADATTGVRNVLRTGRSEIYPVIPEEMVLQGARDEEHRRILVGLKLRSAIVVPLVARGRTLGVISLVFAESGRSYDAGDLAFFEDLARRAAVAIDNAQLYAAEQEARAAADSANKTKDEFLATVSHELRTPLNAILGWARMMAKAPADEARRTRAIETIERNAVAMAQLIEDLLDISRIISGNMRLQMRPVDLARVAQAAIDSLRPGIDAKTITLRAELPADGLPPVVGDATRLQQVLWNLLSNSTKFTPAGGWIDVRLRMSSAAAGGPSGAWVELEVADSGKGISPSFLPEVFDRFRQADGSITRAHGGLGLGLAISRHLVDLHGGRIEARSEGEGRGATFIVSLPAGDLGEPTAVTPPRAMAAAAAPGEARPGPLGALEVLVVDDDADARELVREVLAESGATVRVAGSVDEAARLFDERIPDVLLSDIGMPGQDGFALIRRIRALPAARGGSVPAAALTAYTRAEDRVKVLDAGYTVHLPKPVEPAELISVVAGLARLQRVDTSGAG